MIRVCFYDTKPYDKAYFDKVLENYSNIEIDYFESKLNSRTAILAKGYDASVAFVNDDIGFKTIEGLDNAGVKLLAMRCSGFNNVDLAAAKGRLCVVRVPAYSPYAVAEHAMAMLLTLNRKIHKAYIRTRDFNFSLNRLVGFDLHGKTIGIAGTGKIGRALLDICRGFGMEVAAYDPYPDKNLDVQYMSFEKLCGVSDVISLHCPLTHDTFYMVDKRTLEMMKKNVIIINTSRGALINSEALVEALKNKAVGGACLDVYEEETDLFYEDKSQTIIRDDVLLQLLSLPNVIVTSHQAFLTDEALTNIAQTTIENILDYFEHGKAVNEVTVI